MRYIKQNFKMRISVGYPQKDFLNFSLDTKNKAVLFSVPYFGSASEESQNLLTNIVDPMLSIVGEWKQVHVLGKGLYLVCCLMTYALSGSQR